MITIKEREKEREREREREIDRKKERERERGRERNNKSIITEYMVGRITILILSQIGRAIAGSDFMLVLSVRLASNWWT